MIRKVQFESQERRKKYSLRVRSAVSTRFLLL